MDGLDTVQMRKAIIHERVEVHPTLIPITPTLLADQRISTYYYRVATSDVLNVMVYQHPEFDFTVPVVAGNGIAGMAGVTTSGQYGYLVNPDGRIYFPMVGYIKVANKTVDEIRADLTKRLSKYVPHPQVTVRVANFRSRRVYVLGEVKKPGFLPINDQPLTIAYALALTGGIDNDSADPQYTYVIRGNFGNPEIFWLNARTPDTLLLAQRFSLQPDDILYVSTAPIVRWNRVLSQVAPLVQTIWFTKSIIDNS